MSDETSTIRILDADPERVVSVTVGDLETLLDDGMDVEAGFVGIDTVTIHERTYHNFGGEKGTNAEFWDFGCTACGWIGDMTADNPYFCPHCGARVTSGGER